MRNQPALICVLVTLALLSPLTESVSEPDSAQQADFSPNGSHLDDDFWKEAKVDVEAIKSEISVLTARIQTILFERRESHRVEEARKVGHDMYETAIEPQREAHKEATQQTLVEQTQSATELTLRMHHVGSSIQTLLEGKDKAEEQAEDEEEDKDKSPHDKPRLQTLSSQVVTIESKSLPHPAAEGQKLKAEGTELGGDHVHLQPEIRNLNPSVSDTTASMSVSEFCKKTLEYHSILLSEVDTRTLVEAFNLDEPKNIVFSPITTIIVLNDFCLAATDPAKVVLIKELVSVVIKWHLSDNHWFDLDRATEATEHTLFLHIFPLSALLQVARKLKLTSDLTELMGQYQMYLEATLSEDEPYSRSLRLTSQLQLGLLVIYRSFHVTEKRAKHVEEKLLFTLNSVHFKDEGSFAVNGVRNQFLFYDLLNRGVQSGILSSSPAHLERIRKTLDWMRTPDGVPLLLGSTTYRKPDSLLYSHFRIQPHQPINYKCESDLHVLKEAGFGFSCRTMTLKVTGTKPYISYLAFRSGFFSRIHKSGDDLSFVLFDGYRHIIVESGSDPSNEWQNQQVTSHNTLSTPGVDIVPCVLKSGCLIDGVRRPMQLPTGSGIRGIAQGGKWNAMLAANDGYPPQIRSTVERALIHDPNHMLIVVDRVLRQPHSTDVLHSWKRQFNLASDLVSKIILQPKLAGLEADHPAFMIRDSATSTEERPWHWIASDFSQTTPSISHRNSYYTYSRTTVHLENTTIFDIYQHQQPSKRLVFENAPPHLDLAKYAAHVGEPLSSPNEQVYITVFQTAHRRSGWPEEQSELLTLKATWLSNMTLSLAGQYANKKLLKLMVDFENGKISYR